MREDTFHFQKEKGITGARSRSSRKLINRKTTTSARLRRISRRALQHKVQSQPRTAAPQ